MGAMVLDDGLLIEVMSMVSNVKYFLLDYVSAGATVFKISFFSNH